MTKDLLPPQQDRSKVALERLVNGTIKVLSEHGLEGATIPRIAAAAGVAPASVYRRFRDKESLFRAAFMRALEKGGETSAGLQSLEAQPLEQGAAVVVAILFRQYRTLPRFLKAFRQFLDNQEDANFRHQAQASVERNLQHLLHALLSCAGVETIDNGAYKIRFALLTVGTTIEAIVLDPESLWSTLQPRSDEEIESDLVQMFVAYVRNGR